MTTAAYLVLEDGTIYEGEQFGANTTACGEVVFDTSMTGYQEMLTDPSFAGQLLLLTYPLVGNYGVNPLDNESGNVQPRGLIVREHCSAPSHRESTETLHDYLKKHGIPGISGIDTRTLTRKLRSSGVMTGLLTSSMKPEQALLELPRLASRTSTSLAYEVGCASETVAAMPLVEGSLHVVLVDCGIKRSIIRQLSQAGCHITVVPISTTASRIRELSPDGIMVSPGPGDPSDLSELSSTIRELLTSIPVMGACLGLQVIARALGANTYKLKFGHHGGNHAVKDLSTGRIYITTQNHDYAVDVSSLPDGLQVSHINLNDGTIEGLTHRDLPLISIQYHAEGSPGPKDSACIFIEFVQLMMALR